ncbi:hypothetical protein SEA_ZUCKER_46 [Arthrobacter phage Zucker]|nr:hypothetical protein SEA_ZUCKER_46 [Arthrobacter phage Zucker]
MRTNELGYTLDFAHQCAAWTINNQGPARRQCAQPPIKNIDHWVYLCKRHYDLIFEAIESEVDNLNSLRVQNMRERLHDAEGRIAAAGIDQDRERIRFDIEAHERRRKAQTVYFIRCEQYVKIGISLNPSNRLNQIRKGGGSLFPRRMDVESAEIVATEPGGFDREKELHEQFAHLRHTGEWFTEAPELSQYIDSLSEVAA